MCQHGSDEQRGFAKLDAPVSRTQTGFGVLIEGQIDLRTVGYTERAAKVNGLLVLYRLMVTRNASDGDIDKAWKDRPALPSTEIVPVNVEIAVN